MAHKLDLEKQLTALMATRAFTIKSAANKLEINDIFEAVNSLQRVLEEAVKSGETKFDTDYKEDFFVDEDDMLFRYWDVRGGSRIVLLTDDDVLTSYCTTLSKYTYCVASGLPIPEPVINALRESFIKASEAIEMGKQMETEVVKFYDKSKH